MAEQRSMTNLVWNGVVITSREDGLINATSMCKAGKVYFADWYRLNKTKSLISALEGTMKVKLIHVINGGPDRGSWIHPSLATILAQWIDPEFSLKIIKWIEEWKQISDNTKRYNEALSNLQPSKNTLLEKRIQNKLHAELGGTIEKETSVGRIDLLTETTIIEIKEMSNWKYALGQILAYSLEYPHKSKRIHLFGECNYDKNIIINTCASFNIVVSFENDCV